MWAPRSAVLRRVEVSACMRALPALFLLSPRPRAAAVAIMPR